MQRFSLLILSFFLLHTSVVVATMHPLCAKYIFDSYWDDKENLQTLIALGELSFHSTRIQESHPKSDVSWNKIIRYAWIDLPKVPFEYRKKLANYYKLTLEKIKLKQLKDELDPIRRFL